MTVPRCRSRSPAFAVRRHRRLHAALVHAAEAVGRHAMPCAGALLFGLLAHAIDITPTVAFANVAAEGIFGLMLPIAALIIGDAVLGAEVRGGTFHFTWLSPAPTWQIVLGRWLGGSLVALVTIAPACALAAVVAGSRRAPGRRSSPGRRRGRLRRPVHRHRLHHPAHRGLVVGDRVPRRAPARRRADGHRPALADVGVAGDLRRPRRGRPAAPRARRHPAGPAPSCGSR